MKILRSPWVVPIRDHLQIGPSLKQRRARWLSYSGMCAYIDFYNDVCIWNICSIWNIENVVVNYLHSLLNFYSRVLNLYKYIPAYILFWLGHICVSATSVDDIIYLGSSVSLIHPLQKASWASYHHHQDI